MLQNSFVHLPSIGAQTETQLWSSGCHTWEHLENQLPKLFGRARAAKLALAIEESRAAHDAGELSYFVEKLKGSEKWRLLPTLLERGESHLIAYLDIETTGLGFPPECESTTIAVLFNGELFVEHEPARKRALIKRLQNEAKLFVTFNGLTFDLPFLRREYGLQLQHPHVDLRYWFANLGFSGGLKRIQTGFPEIHQRGSMDIDGFDAVRLWRLHNQGVANALETLKTYNAEDTIVLEQLVFLGLNLEARRRPTLSLKQHEFPRSPKIATQVCAKVYRMLRG